MAVTVVTGAVSGMGRARAELLRGTTDEFVRATRERGPLRAVVHAAGRSVGDAAPRRASGF